MRTRRFLVIAGAVSAVVALAGAPAVAGRPGPSVPVPVRGIAAAPAFPRAPGWAPGQAASGAADPALTLSSTTADLRTSTSVSVGLDVYAEQYPHYLWFTVGLVHPVPAGTEFHGWGFGLPRSWLRYSRASGRGSVTTGSRHITPFGQITLRFTRTAVHQRACTMSGSKTFYRGTLSGTVSFRPGGRWGSLGSLRRRFTFPGRSLLTFDRGCTERTPPTPTCFTRTEWSWSKLALPNQTQNLYVYGVSTPTRSWVGAIRDVFALPRPRGAERYDELVVREPKQSLSSVGTPPSSWTLHAPMAPGRAVSGSNVTVTATKSSDYNFSCLQNGTKQTQYEFTYYDGPFTVAPRGLTAHFGVGGNLTLHNNANTAIFNDIPS